MKNSHKQYLRFGQIALLLILICSIGILAWVPPVSRDALTHHLAVPKLYLQHGGMYEIPSIVFSYYPMNLELLYLIPLYFGNDIAPKYIHFIFGLLTAALIFTYLRKRLNAEWALFGVLFFLSLPIIVKLSITVYVDLGLVFFSTAALISMLKWIECRFKIRYLILSAIGCGLALGTKYNALILLFILTLFTPLVYISVSKNNPDTKHAADSARSIKFQLSALGFGAIFFAVALLVFSPWMIRNLAWKSNPIYPLYDSVFKRLIPAADVIPPDSQRLETAAEMPEDSKSTPWSPFAVRKVIYGESWWEIVSIPIRIFFQGQDDNPKYFDGKLSPFLFFLPFFAFIQFKKNPSAVRTEKKILLFFALIFLFYAISTTVIRIRYAAPIIPPLVILATFGLHQISRTVTKGKSAQRGWIGPGVVMLLAAIILALNASYIFMQFRNVDPFGYIRGRVSRDDYIAKYRPEYSTYQYANRHLPDDVKILGLFLGNRLYYSELDLRFDFNEFKNIVNHAGSEKDILSGLQEQGYTYLIIRFDLFNQWTNKQFDDKKKEMLKTFFTVHVKHLFSKDGYGLFELKNNL